MREIFSDDIMYDRLSIDVILPIRGVLECPSKFEQLLLCLGGCSVASGSSAWMIESY